MEYNPVNEYNRVGGKPWKMFASIQILATISKHIA